ncbi:MAG TPA: hypothetical protein VHA75_13225 [Rugosimonospora sp.]|nr:hypothetical protein [Rugosimonospora sp.]
MKIEGAEKLAALGKAVRAMGSDRTIIKALTKRIRTLGTPVKTELKTSALAVLPKRGGLAAWVAKSRLTISVRRGTHTAGISIKQGRNSAGGRTDLRAIDRGRLRHPMLGDREHWYTQQITPGFWSDVIDGPAADQFQQEAVAAIDDALAEVAQAVSRG